ncbi:MAG: DUF805 domain-containing protein [Caulobacteraceae bacterium]|nr:MAG: DUF805 domain-containing protein [Caulobacteraceae bacterium]
MAYVRKLFSVKGRIRRLDYWVANILLFGVMIAVAQGLAHWQHVDLDDKSDIRAVTIQFIAAMVVVWPNMATGIKRLHDRNQSGWWILLSFLPVVGNVWMLINLGMMRGTEGVNRYGSEPERPQFTLFDRGAAAA